MEFLNYLLVSIAAFSGLWFGAALAFIAPEEMKAGERYFRMMAKALFLIVAVLIALTLKEKPVYIPLTFMVFCIIFGIFCPEKFIRQYTFPLIGIFFYVSSKDASLFPIVAALIFLLSLPKGSVFAKEHTGMRKMRILRKILISHVFFFIFALPLYFSNL